MPLPGSRAYRKLRMMSAKVKAAEVFVGWNRTGLSILVVEASKHVVPFRVVLLALLSPSLNDSHHSCYAPTWFQSHTAEFVCRWYCRRTVCSCKYTFRRPCHCFSLRVSVMFLDLYLRYRTYIGTGDTIIFIQLTSTYHVCIPNVAILYVLFRVRTILPGTLILHNNQFLRLLTESSSIWTSQSSAPILLLDCTDSGS